ncbi:MAG TPA: ABC transporter ATP-binding protein [Burkholderiales bacterium]|nr:ABC transporter ATP-binding protein [Burkholderiales bacterium]
MVEPLLALRGLTKRFGGLTATDGVTLDIAPGEIHALIGPNGAGKTTLIHQISGALPPDHGSVTFGGREITRLAMHERVAAGLVRSFQVTNIFQRFSVLDNVALAVQAGSGSSMGFWRPVAREAALFGEARELLARIDLADKAASTAATLAHGEQRQLEVGLALATRPKLLLLDEPLAGMGPEESERMVQLVAGLARTCTILLVEHDMQAVFRLATRISVLVSGRIIASGAPDDVRRDSEVRRAYLGDEVPSAAA